MFQSRGISSISSLLHRLCPYFHPSIHPDCTSNGSSSQQPPTVMELCLSEQQCLSAAPLFVSVCLFLPLARRSNASLKFSFAISCEHIWYPDAFNPTGIYLKKKERRGKRSGEYFQIKCIYFMLFMLSVWNIFRTVHPLRIGRGRLRENAFIIDPHLVPSFDFTASPRVHMSLSLQLCAVTL